jgi:hypothetical protein
LLLTYLSLHFVAVMSYSFFGEERTKVYYYSYTYLYPYFHQDWNLFVPSPKQNFKVLVKYKIHGVERDWQDIFFEINSKHQNNRLRGKEAILLALSNSLRYYSGSVKEESAIESKDENVNYKVLEKMVSKCISNFEGTEPRELEILVGIYSTKSKLSHFHYYKD